MKRERITQSDIAAIRRIYHNGDIPARILADEIGVAENTFYRWLSGSRNPGYLVTARIKQFIKAHTIPRKALAKTEAKVAEYRKRGKR